MLRRKNDKRTGPFKLGSDFSTEIHKGPIGWYGTFTDRISGGLGVGPTHPIWRPTHKMLLRALELQEANSRKRNG